MKNLIQRAVLLTLALLIVFLPSCIQMPSDAFEDLEARDLVWAVGSTMPKASDFFEDLPSELEASFTRTYDFTGTGTYSVEISVVDGKGTEKLYEATLSIILDTEPPQVVGAKDLQAYIGDGIAYRTGVSVVDNCHDAVTLEVDSSAVNLQQEGAYPVFYIATDAVGNRSKTQITLYLYLEKITEKQLFAMLEESFIKKAGIPTAGSREAQVRAVYNYVYYYIDYTATSDKNDWVRAAYDGLREGRGDCYTYFAVSKAFFEYLGIDNMDIQRTVGLIDERHYWNFVNIGTAENPEWYHFDACQLMGATHSGCLLTDVQVNAYTKMRVGEKGERNYFYAYDQSKYPASATNIITYTPSLEAYY